MIGTNAVYAAPVTLGKPGFGTPTGTFRIFSRVANETMDSLTIGIPRTAAEGYYLKNVLYTQYFADGGVALHSNYWQPEWVFGQANTSHGCVGLRTADAAYFWSFAGNGTRVVVE
jgi:lipoprotein-anchoring transpeptidase ErfK/SrfK